MVQRNQEENGKEAESTKVVAETKKQTKKLTFNHVHNAELVPGSEKTIKRKRELEKKRLTTSFTNRLDEEKLMLQKMKETVRIVLLLFFKFLRRAHIYVRQLGFHLIELY